MKMRLLIVTVALGITPASAQEPTRPSSSMQAGAKASDKSTARVRVLNFRGEAPIQELFGHRPDTEQPGAPIKFAVRSYLNHEATPIPRGTADLVITTSPDPQSATRPDGILGKVSFPDSDSVLLVVLSESRGETKQASKVFALDDSKKAFPAGSFNVINLTGKAVKIRLQDSDFAFRSGEMRTVSNPPVGADNCSAMVATYPDQGSEKRFASGVWPHPGTKRSLQFVFDDPKGGGVQIIGIRDVSLPRE